MRIALLGYGKMGKEIEQIALAMGHKINLKIDKNNYTDFNFENCKQADVAIEFSQPDSVFGNISKCFDFGIPVVVGTTGWYERTEEIKELCKQKNGSMLYASNFSIGVNLFFDLNRKLAAMMKQHTDYKISIEEIHHTQKLDKPSGTAITLANEIISQSHEKKSWSIEEGDKEKKGKLFIHSIRKENVVGIHTVNYESDIDKIEISHEAFNRKGFAKGAVLAAQWLIGKKGFYQFSDIINEL
ncbi:MAG: 4-hydroxy-tetrahydrodipicolinate reductase [Bacteroidia bacterium]